jgi:hypothetical protein
MMNFLLKKLEAEGEQMNSAGGKLDELNTILSKTQHKLSTFKVISVKSIDLELSKTVFFLFEACLR